MLSAKQAIIRQKRWFHGPIAEPQAAANTLALRRPAGNRLWRGSFLGWEYAWAVAFCTPYLAVFLAFIVYPIGFGLWMGSDPSLYPTLFADPVYAMTVFNTALYVGIAVNLKMVCALLLSGFFMRPGWWMKALLMLFVLP